MQGTSSTDSGRVDGIGLLGVCATQWPSDEDCALLVVRFQSGDRVAGDILIRAAFPTISRHARRVGKPDVEHAASCLIAAAWEALTTFDANRGISVKHHVYRKLRWVAALHYTRRLDMPSNTINLHAAASMSHREDINKDYSGDSTPSSLEDRLSSEHTPESLCEEADTNRHLRVTMLEFVDPRQMAVLRHRFWENRTQKETAQRLGISLNQVQYAERTSIAMLREAIGEKLS